MQVVTLAIVPILVVMTVGYVLRRRWFTSPSFWSGLESLNYLVLMPALFINSIGQADLSAIPFAKVALTLAVPFVSLTVLLLLLRPVLRVSGPSVTSMIQGAIRFNTYSGLIFASALAGSEGLAVFSVVCTIAVPMVNVLCVTALILHGDNDATLQPLSILKQLLTNPLVLGCLVGMAISLSPVVYPQVLDATLGIFADAALVTGTLAVGAALKFDVNRKDAGILGLTSAIKLGLVPLVVYTLGQWLGIEGVALAGVLILAALPTAPSAYVLAVKLGGDTRLMSSLSGVQTVLALVTMPLWLMLV